VTHNYINMSLHVRWRSW